MKPSRAALAAFGIAAVFLVWLAFVVGVGRGGGDGDRFDADPSAGDPWIGTQAEEEDVELDPALSLEVDPGVETREPSAAEPSAGSHDGGTSVAAPAADAAVVAGLLVDAGTGEPLPHYALRILDAAKRREDVLTDERGRFETGSPMAGGTIRIVPFDDPGHGRSLPGIAVERRVDDGQARDLDLSVPCGPTYFLAISPGEAVVPTTLVARLRIRSPDDVRELGPEPVRAGDPPWVRFAPVPEDYDRCDRIELRSRDGLWLGSAGVSTLAGVAPGPARVELGARAVLLGKVVEQDGAPVRGASVVFEGVTAAGRSHERKASTRADGSYRFEYLPDGVGTVSVRSLAHVPYDKAIRLPGKGTTQQDFILASLPSAGAIRGHLASETGTYEAQVEVVLRPLASAAILGSPPHPATVSVLWQERSGRRVGDFEFGALPAGEYELSVRDGSWFSWQPRTLTVSPPFEGARFVVRDDLAHADFAFRLRDGETGESLDAAFAWWSVRGGASGSEELRGEEVFLSAFPLERGFHWRLDQKGYRPAFGDAGAFAVEEMGEGRIRRIAEIALEPGWGEVFRVVRRGNKKAIAGAKILLDGREAGATKRDGTCLVAARERPGKVEIAYRDWKVSAPVDLRPAWRRKEKRFVEILVVSERN